MELQVCSRDPVRCAGVIAVAVYGLYGAATNKWDIHIKIEAGGAFDAFWETIAFIVNGIIFFYSGVACINFIVRSAAVATTMRRGLPAVVIAPAVMGSSIISCCASHQHPSCTCTSF